MTNFTNQKITLVARPVGMPLLSDFRLESEAINDLEPGHALVSNEVLSIDAFIRTVLNEQAYHGGLQLGGTVTALGVGRILESNDPSLAVGDTVFGPLGAQTIARLPAAALRKIDTSRFPTTAYLGALGLTTGVTAYVGMTRVAQVKEGDIVVVSGAAGAVGSFAGQIARRLGASKVIGIAGGPQKVAFLVNTLGFDAAIDYKSENIDARIRELAPNGIDVFYDNVGGDALDAALLNLHEGTRVTICGGISNYGDMDNVRGPKNYLKLAENHARMEGFAVTHFPGVFAEAEAKMADWLDAGEIVIHEQYEHGIDRFPDALLTLLSGGHMGKMMLDLRSP